MYDQFVVWCYNEYIVHAPFISGYLLINNLIEEDNTAFCIRFKNMFLKEY